MPRPSRPVARAGALALGALLLGGCTGSGGERQAQPSAPLDELVEAAAAASAASTSSRITLTNETTSGQQQVVLVGEGAYAHAAREGRLVFTVPGAGGGPSSGGTIEERLLGDQLYLSLPQPQGVFYALRLADVAGTSLGSSAVPTASLQALQEVTGVEEAGRVEVRGVEATRYRGELDVEQAIAGATGAAQQVLEATLRPTTLDTLPFEAYVDGEGRLVKLVQSLDVPAGPATGGRAVTSRSTLELYDFGAPVDVAAPPSASVRDGAPLLAALRGAAPTSPPASPSPSGSPAG